MNFPPKPLPTATMALAAIFFLASCTAIAQTPATPSPASCVSTSGRAAGLIYVPTKKSLSDLSITIAKSQKNNLALADVTLLKGPCANDAYAFRMAQIIFEDGAVFTAKSDDRFSYSQDVTGLAKFGAVPFPAEHPEVAQAQFIMASNVDTADITSEKRSLEVGLWKLDEDYLVAAYIRQDGGFSVPVELVRSTQPIKSVTYFPSPDSHSGKLGLLESTPSGIALLSLGWDHTVLSKILIDGK